jgi:hypothetical protein
MPAGSPSVIPMRGRVIRSGQASGDQKVFM